MGNLIRDVKYGARSVVLGRAPRRSRYGRGPSVLNRNILLSGEPRPVVGVIASVAVCLVAARRAVKIDPMGALRYE